MPNYFPLILTVAGRGTRLPEISHPKCLLDFDGKTLIEHFTQSFLPLGITHLILCVGYQADKIAEQIGEVCCGLPVHYIFNPIFYKTGVGYSVKLAKEHWVGFECIIADGDQLIHPNIAKLLLNPDTILVDSETQPQFGEETIILGSKGSVDQIVWPAYGFENSKDVVGEALVISRISANSTQKLYTLLNQGEMIDALNEVISSYVDVKGLPWIEIDNIEDMKSAEKVYANFNPCLRS